jgi:hypothetical protein
MPSDRAGCRGIGGPHGRHARRQQRQPFVVSTEGSCSSFRGLYRRVIRDVFIMAADKPSLFHCPNCNALYQVVKVETGHETVGREITCLCCEAPLIGREGNLVVKYFLLRKGDVLEVRNAPAKSTHNQKRPGPRTSQLPLVLLWSVRPSRQQSVDSESLLTSIFSLAMTKPGRVRMSENQPRPLCLRAASRWPKCCTGAHISRR